MARHVRKLNVPPHRTQLVHLAEMRAALNGQSLSDYIWTLVEDDLRQLPNDLDALKRDVLQTIRQADDAERKKLEIA